MMRNRTDLTRKILILALLAMTTVLVASCGKSDYTKAAENFVDSLSKGDTSSASSDFNPTLKTFMTADALRVYWTASASGFGAFRGRKSTREAQEQGCTVVCMTCEFDKGNLDVKITFDNNKKISGLSILPSKATTAGN